ncbi:MAG: zinc-ribbon domain-containing protein [Anaerolineales bacterium]
MKCPSCGNETQEDAIFCDQCGFRLPGAAPAAPAAGMCRQCGAANTPGELFCSECGAPLDAPAPEVSAAPVAAPAAAAAPAAPAPTPEPAAAPAAAPAPALACPKCGAPAEPGDAFCSQCGASLATQPAAQPAPAVSTATPAPAAPAAPAAAPEPTTPALDQCPSCGADVTPGAAFCDFCGAALVGGAAATAQAVTAIAPAPPTQVAPVAPAPLAAAPALSGPCLTVVASGTVIPLTPVGEVLVGRDDPQSNIFPDVDLTPYGGEEGGVSRRHFKLTLGEGQYAIQDLHSTNSTWLNHTRLQPGVPVALHDGDEIRAGRVRLLFTVR